MAGEPYFYSVIRLPSGELAATPLGRISFVANTIDLPGGHGGVNTDTLTTEAAAAGANVHLTVGTWINSEGEQELIITDKKTNNSQKQTIGKDYFLTKPDAAFTGTILYGDRRIALQIITDENRLRRNIPDVRVETVYINTVNAAGRERTRGLINQEVDVYLLKEPRDEELVPPVAELLKTRGNFMWYKDVREDDNDADTDFNAEKVCPVAVTYTQYEGLVISGVPEQDEDIVIPNEVILAMGGAPIELLYYSGKSDETVKGVIEHRVRRI